MDPESAPILDAAARGFLGAARRAVLVTITPDGRPRPVPICFSLDPDRPILYTPIDDKPKRSSDPLALARVRDISADPRVTVLVDRWDEDWTRLAWLRAEGRATLLAAGPPEAPDEAHPHRGRDRRAPGALPAVRRPRARRTGRSSASNSIASRAGG